MTSLSILRMMCGHFSDSKGADEMWMRAEARARRTLEETQTRKVLYQDGDLVNGSVMLGARHSPPWNEMEMDRDRGMS